MFNIQDYVSPFLVNYIDKYLRNFNPADAQVSLWSGGVTLHNLELKTDVVQQEFPLPFTLLSGRIHELLIHVPWTKLMSDPVVVTINTIECILSLNPPSDETNPQAARSGRSQLVQTPPGYVQALLRRILSNLSVQINSLIVKYLHDDIVLSLNVDTLTVTTVGVNWEPTSADPDENYQNEPAIRRLIYLDDVTLCLDKSDADGKIRYFHEPLLYRCELKLRVLTKLDSAVTRRVKSVSIQLLSNQLPFGIHGDQLVLLLRLLTETIHDEQNVSPPMQPRPSYVQPPLSNVQPPPIHTTPPIPSESVDKSWAEWAWSWLPAWDPEEIEEIPAIETPVPVSFTAHFNFVSLLLKVTHFEGKVRKQRGILELMASDTVIKMFMCSPTRFRLNIGVRELTLAPRGNCLCGHSDINAINNETRVYMKKIDGHIDEPWTWVDDDINELEVVDEEIEEHNSEPNEHGEDIGAGHKKTPPSQEEIFWRNMNPVIYFEYNHERMPADPLVNPLANTPIDFQYSDWVESSTLKVLIRPIMINVSTGMIHRFSEIIQAYKKLPVPTKRVHQIPTLTVEECEALNDNLPLRQIKIDVTGLRVAFIPFQHEDNSRPTRPPLCLELQLPIVTIKITLPLYPHRVCSAASQLPNETGLLAQAARLHASINAKIQVGICPLEEDAPRLCARADVRFVAHVLLNKQYFNRPETVLFNSTLSIKEANVFGSLARLQATYQIANSLIEMKITDILRYTTLADDALNDEDYVAIDITVEELLLRTLLTINANTHFMTLKTIKATAYQDPADDVFKQAWIFSAPETPCNKPYLKVGLQWCNDPNDKNAIEYVNISTRSTALSIDPMLYTWLSYSYALIGRREHSIIQNPNLNVSSSQNLPRRRVTPPSSSGQGGSGSGAEQVHVRPKTLESNSETSDKKQSDTSITKNQEPEKYCWLLGENMLKLHSRLNRLLVSIKVGVTQIYICSTTVSALDSVTVRDAMERHVTATHRVLVVGLGRLQVESNPQLQCYWEDINFEYPTCKRPLRDPRVNDNAFPWKIRISDMSCYTLQVRPGTESSGREKSVSGLRSQLKPSRVLVSQTILETVTTNITLSVVIKNAKIVKERKNNPRSKPPDHKQEEDKTKYFKTGSDFKPSSVKEFIRGPSRPNKLSPEPGPSQPPSDPEPEPIPDSTGRIISIGVNVHADTPPIIVRLDQDQVHTVAIAMHCFAHVMALLRFQTTTLAEIYSANTSSKKLPARSASDLEERPSVSEGTRSSIISEQLISLYEANRDSDHGVKTFFWFQWVVSHVALVLTTSEIKLAFDVDDIISSVDIQGHYNQFKLKIASAALRNYKRMGSRDWIPGPMDGRIIEVREPTNAEEENHILLVTVTQALVSNLPYCWKEELNHKLAQPGFSYKVDSIWEVYATLAPLEAVIQPPVLECLITWLHELTPHSTCSLQNEATQISLPKKRGTWDWPFCYVTAGGLRLLITTSEEVQNADDTLILILGKTTVSPRAENPICRQPANKNSDNNGSNVNLCLESRQYEILIRHVAVRSANFNQLVNHEIIESQNSKSKVRENPALKWSRTIVQPVITPILHGVDVGCILAPAMYEPCGTLASGPAIEFNLLSDCSIEIGIHSLELMRIVPEQVLHVFRQRPRSSFDEEYICPYIIQKINPSPSGSAITFADSLGEVSLSSPDTYNFDSGVETTTSRSNINKEPVKKSAIMSTFDHLDSEFLEVFVTMGVIDISLYVKDDGSREVKELRPPIELLENIKVSEPRIKVVIDDTKVKEASKVDDDEVSRAASKSLTETNRNKDAGKIKLDEIQPLPLARSAEGNLPLFHVTLSQPNLYYWNKPTQKTIQVSLFNAWIGLGMGQNADQWNIPLLKTKKGSPDAITDIPPALATLRFDLSIDLSKPNSPSHRGIVQIDVERPVMFEVSTDRIRRIKLITDLIKANIKCAPAQETAQPNDPFLYKLRRNMVDQQIDNVIIQTSQIGLRGSKGVLGCDAVRMQLAASERPDKLNCRGLVTAAVVSVGCFRERRHVLLQPLTAGIILDANWEAWKKLEGGPAAREPTLRIGVDFDGIILNIRPFDLTNAFRILDAIWEINEWVEIVSPPDMTASTSSDTSTTTTSITTNEPTSFTDDQTYDTNDQNNQFYKDDLRSGAFKIVFDSQLPMAYQITLHGPVVAWRYPHPRAITRLVVFPIPDLDAIEIKLVLELFCPILARWEAVLYFQLPVEEPNEILLSSSPADAVFAFMWRVRPRCDSNNDEPFLFESRKFMPLQDPLLYEATPPKDHFKKPYNITAQQLSGVLQVDSYFAPRFLPRAHVALRLASVEINLHNAFPIIPRSRTKTLEGCYVSRPINANHRMLTVQASNSVIHYVNASSTRVLLDTYIMSDLIDSASGTMEKLIQEFHMLGSMVISPEPRTRLRISDVRIMLHISQIYTLTSLIDDWIVVLKRYTQYKNKDVLIDKRVHINDAAVALSGRVYMWIHNKCTDYICVGQESTEEVITISPGASLAYRWHTPEAPHKLQFSLPNSTKQQWSKGIEFVTGSQRARLDKEIIRGSGTFLYVRVTDSGDRRDMYLSGRIVLANVSRYSFLYKLRMKYPTQVSDGNTITIGGNLQAESVGLSVLCNSDCTATLQVTLFENTHKWSGEIPLRICRRRNVPWLIKIPNEAKDSFASMWLRVIPTIKDGRIVATFWPFYMLRSDLPLDIQVFITSEGGSGQRAGRRVVEQHREWHTTQSAEGRGSITHLLAQGTTSVFHKLTFKYENTDCPVTPEPVMLNYGVVKKSVFAKPMINTAEEALVKIKQWINKSRKDTQTKWPYSIVTNHWDGVWQAGLMQPHCNVNVHFEAVHDISGCSLAMILSPIALVANSSSVSLTLRAYDATPLFKLDPGVAVAPPSIILEHPFFMSVEKVHEVFVSGQLEVCKTELGQYEQPEPGQIALKRPANFAVQTDLKVALLTIHYEILENINVLGITNTYVLLNMLSTNLLVSPIAQPSEMDNSIMRSVNIYDIVSPTKRGSIHGTPLSWFSMNGRWRGGDADQLRALIYLALPSDGQKPKFPVPVRLGIGPSRRSISLKDEFNQSVPIVVMQLKHQGRWLIAVAEDPCPQYVVHNRTKTTLAVAQPLNTEGTSTAPVQTAQECSCVQWWCVVESKSMSHYSTPAYCAQYPAAQTVSPSLPFLTVALRRDEGNFKWCHPIAITDGEHLLQLSGGVTIKLRVRTHPHSTLLELQDVDQNDISASDIRRRLGMFAEANQLEDENKSSSIEAQFRRVGSKYFKNKSKGNIDQPKICSIYDDPKPSTSKQMDPGDYMWESSSRDYPTNKTDDSSSFKMSPSMQDDVPQAYKNELITDTTVTRKDSSDFSETSYLLEAVTQKDWSNSSTLWSSTERFRCLIDNVIVFVGASSDVAELIALHLQRVAVVVQSDNRMTKSKVTVGNVHVDNAQYEIDLYDFAVIATTRSESDLTESWPALWAMFNERLPSRDASAKLLLKTLHDKWTVANRNYQELTEVELRFGPMGLYIEDDYISAVLDLYHLVVPATPSAQTPESLVLAEIHTMQHPVRLRRLYIHPVNLTLTLHTAMRMYIALDESPLNLGAYRLEDTMISYENLAHAMTVHYLSAAIFGAGWVVGGLELLGAPGALAARVGNAGGGIRGVISATAGAFLRSLSSAAGSLARNLDMLAGDDEHARRAAAARRRPPPNLMAGLITGLTNFGVNILGAVGGLAHHPLVGVAVGETDSGVSALRRGLIGAITKPLSATADLVAFAGHGLLNQIGWDPVPRPRTTTTNVVNVRMLGGWRRDCVRYGFRFRESIIAGLQALVNNNLYHLIITQRCLLIVDPETDSVSERVEFDNCTIGTHHGQVIELLITQQQEFNDDATSNTTQASADTRDAQAAMARVARYTGTEGYDKHGFRVLSLTCVPGTAHMLLALLYTLLHSKDDTYFSLV